MNRSPNPDEAAAIAAALERFIAETAPAEVEVSEAVSPWQQAALAEGIGAKRAVLEDPEGGLRWLS